MVAKAKGNLLADSDDTKVVQGKHYFPPESINKDFFEKSDHRTTDPAKGEAHYYHINVDGDSLDNAAWYYPNPGDKLAHIKNHVAFSDEINISA